MEKRVSVVIPFYNNVKWLSEAVDSVLTQTYKNFEIIVVNDGSPEMIDDFLLNYNDKIRYFYKINEGPASARNLALTKVTGDYVAFLDSDDVWLPDKTVKQIAFMENSGAKWSHTGFYYWHSDTGKISSPKISHNYDNVFIQGFITLKISTPSVIVCRSVLEVNPEICFPQNERYGQDSSFFRQLAFIYPLGLVEEPLMKIRLRGNNTNSRGVVRIECNSRLHKTIKSSDNEMYKNLPKGILIILSIYNFYSRILNWARKEVHVNSKYLEYISKILWTIPFGIERIYVHYFLIKQNKDDKYILRK